MQQTVKQFLTDIAAISGGIVAITITQFFDPMIALGIFLVGAVLAVVGIASITMSVCDALKDPVTKFKRNTEAAVKTVKFLKQIKNNIPFYIHFFGVANLGFFFIYMLFRLNELSHATVIHYNVFVPVTMITGLFLLGFAVLGLSMGHILIHHKYVSEGKESAKPT